MRRVGLLVGLILALVLSGCTAKPGAATFNDEHVDAVDAGVDAVVEDQGDVVVEDQGDEVDSSSDSTIYFSEVPEYSGSAVVVMNDNLPYFDDGFFDAASAGAMEFYSDLDDYGRVGMAFACLGLETMPAEGEERGEIGMIKPVGWHTVKYPEVIKDLYLYNRCHLIGWQLGAENDNELNLMTGTRYLNVDGMLPFENAVADYITSTGNHVVYRITPDFRDDELVARGLLMEARSVEDNGCVFCVYCYNVQPGVCIDYATGDSWLEDGTGDSAYNTEFSDEGESSSNSEFFDDVETVSNEAGFNSADNSEGLYRYVLNTNSMKVHLPSCESVERISAGNIAYSEESLEELEAKGYEPCKICLDH